MVILCIIGALPFILFGVLTAYFRHWVVSAWCAVVVAAFADWGRCLVLHRRGTIRKRPYGAKGASYVAGALALLSFWAAIFLPSALKVREKVKFNKAVRWLTAIDDAEYHSLVANGSFSKSVLASSDYLKPSDEFSLDISFSTGTPASWTATMQRKPLFLDYCPIEDCYTATYKSVKGEKRGQEGLPGTFTCNNSECTVDFLPQ